MKLKKGFLLSLLCMFSLFLLVGCQKEKDYSGYTYAVFCLEGGAYQEAVPLSGSINQLCVLDENGECYLFDPNQLGDGNVITRNGYTLDGWYRTKVGEGDDAVYSNPWDFEKDKMTKDGVTLYAKWKKVINHGYDLYYKNEQGEDILIYSYNVANGAKFNDLLNQAAAYGKRNHKTFYGYFDSFGEEWDNNYALKVEDPEIATRVKVYARFIDNADNGKDWILVREASDLSNLSNTDNNIYLMNDIDMEGKSLSFKDFKGVFEGNNHAIKNFSISYETGFNALENDAVTDEPNRLHIGLFRKLSNATVQNVKFENVTCVVEAGYSRIAYIHVSPFAVEIENSTIQNVTFECEVKIGDSVKIGYDVQDNQMYYKKDNNSTIDGVYNVTIVPSEA